ncbi:hypothetical protein IWZ03DRAFT_147061 [Phyllosticta citriasiana]|uniref:Uncharacterized protein n=1 Tax=Phyllosticta citriasiana TaxID=595635 RepID=A0ABR1KNH4_9PEZI
MPKSLKRLSSDSFRRTRSRKRADDDGPRPLPQYHVWRDEPGQNVERGIEEGVARGVHGETRNDGEMIANGENGVNEEREINGETRVTEEDGVSGERRINEETRVRGEDGVNEERGIDEDTGVEENNEERGLDGETAVDVEAEILQERGADGKDTANGERGLDGQEYVVNGERESNGANGINGESGVDGEDRVDGEVDREVQGTDNLSVNRADSPSSGPSALGPQDNCKLAGPLASPRNGAISPRALTPPPEMPQLCLSAEPEVENPSGDALTPPQETQQSWPLPEPDNEGVPSSSPAPAQEPARPWPLTATENTQVMSNFLAPPSVQPEWDRTHSPTPSGVSIQLDRTRSKRLQRVFRPGKIPVHCVVTERPRFSWKRGIWAYVRDIFEWEKARLHRNREIRRRDDDDDGAPPPEPISKRAKLLRRRTNARCEGLTTSVPTIIEPLRRSNSAPEIIVNLEET